KPVFNVLKIVFMTYIKIVVIYIKTVITVFKFVFGTIKTIVISVCGFIGSAFKAVGGVINGIWDTVAGTFKGFVNLVISGINFLIGGLNKISFKVPKWVPLIGGKGFGFNIPKLPKLAKGTMNWKGGSVVVHDQGGEVIDLPRGSRVYPHDKSVDMAREQGRRQGNVTINVKVEGMVIREEADIYKVATAIAKKIKEAEANTGG
ncbi:MAG TPA: phage tail tape measure protein, partial [Clostridia bacterium]|nr:phage tail tape measure protein [Clostridia bacterium]